MEDNPKLSICLKHLNDFARIFGLRKPGNRIVQPYTYDLICGRLVSKMAMRFLNNVFIRDNGRASASPWLRTIRGRIYSEGSAPLAEALPHVASADTT